LDERTGHTERSSGALKPEPACTSAAPQLLAAIRRARIEEAERSEGQAELRGAEIARLEMLMDALQPVLQQIPAGIDLFDVALMPSAHPRLFIDMIGFVEMGRDRRLYRFVQDTRNGRIKIAESEKIDTIVKSVTDYIARRLVEREKALAAMDVPGDAPPLKVQAGGVEAKISKPSQSAGIQQIFGFTIDLLGSMLLFILIIIGSYYSFVEVSAWFPGKH